jgi:hypothetical protein
MQSYKPEVMADDTGIWYPNHLAFATEQEALSYVRDLARRWTAVRDIRVVTSNQSVNAEWTGDSWRDATNPPQET